jgi:hypothetical protein
MLLEQARSRTKVAVCALSVETAVLTFAIQYTLAVCLNIPVAVTSREVVGVFLKQFWFNFMPVFHGMQQGPLKVGQEH